MRPYRSFSAPSIAAAVWSLFAIAHRAVAQELPVACSAGTCGAGGPTAWVTSGAVTGAVTGNRFDIVQQSAKAVLNWRSFNIGKDGVVEFKQPDSDAVALNRIFQSDPSRILGALRANGQVYLINQNGIVFGDGAQVNVGGLLASSLDLSPNAVQNGVTSITAQPALNRFRSATGAELPSGDVAVEPGAQIVTTEGGRVLLFGPNVTNRGTIEAPAGQVMLAAGAPVYLAAQTADPDLRGLIVEIGVGGTVTNGEASNANVADAAALVGRLVAERGNVTLAGLAVNQLGRVSATTSVRAGGSIRLLARDHATLAGESPVSGVGGALKLGERSVTEVSLVDDPTETTVDVNAQPPSTVTLEGGSVDLLAKSLVKAPGGSVTITAQQSWGNRPTPGKQGSNGIPDGLIPTPDTSRIYVADGATIDVAGADISLPMERNVIVAELRGSQVADSPNQRDGALRSKKVHVDVRASGTRADGTTWQGTPLADLSGDFAVVPRSVQERTLAGGTVNLVTQGDLVLGAGSTVDLSGGAIQYRDGYIKTTSVVGQDGRLYDIAEADPDRTYVGLAEGIVVEHKRWGVTETFPTFLGGPGRFEAGYIEGKDAGTLRLIAPRAVADGTILASTFVGRYQRQPATTIPSGRLYRSVAERPVGGRLLIGNGGAPSAVLDGLRFEERAVLPTLVGADGQPFDPLRDRLTEDQATLTLRPSLLRRGAVTRLRVDVDDAIAMPAATRIATDPGSSIDLHATGAIDLDGEFVALGGSLSAGSGATLTLGPTARIDVSGQWVNDDWRLGPESGTEPLFINGGSVTLSAGELDTSDGVTVSANSGALRISNGSVRQGKGGSIGLVADTFVSGETSGVLSGTFEAFARGHGGSLAITADSVCVSSTECAGLSPDALVVGPERFLQGGFGSYSLTATAGDLRIGAGTTIVPVQRNWLFDRDTSLIPTGTSLTSFTRRQTLPEDFREPVDLSFRVAHNNAPVQRLPYTLATFPLAGVLVMESGASILAEPGATVSFSSNTRMLIDGLVSAPGGRIAASLPATLSALEFLPSQSITIGNHGRLDASGAALIRRDGSDLRVGEVLPGGEVTLTADRGFVAVDPGATIDVSGTSGVLDFLNRDLSGGVGAPVIAPRTVASAGGSVELTAAEGVFLAGNIRAASGAPAEVAGGSITVTLDPNKRDDVPPTTYSPRGDRDIRVLAADAPLVFGTSLPEQLYGVALLPAQRLTASGADTIRLHAANTRSMDNGTTNILTGVGTISFVDDVVLSARSRIELDAAVLHSSGASARVAAPVVMLGNTDLIEQVSLPVPATGSGSLTVDGDLIELVGRSAASGLAALNLQSSGDLRLRGIAGVGDVVPTGGLRTGADVTLRARQIYPTTLSDFTITSVGIEAEDGTRVGGRIETQRAPGARAPVYSAGGHLRLEADAIEHSGELLAPFGSVDLVGQESVVLNNGSRISTSANGLTIPFGVTQGGFDWAYVLPTNLTTLVFGPEKRPLPAQDIAIDAPEIDFRAGATIDLTGGGDLLAYEFVPGVTGTRDVLATARRPDQFAILPRAALAFAPYDAAESAGFGLPPGQNLTIPVGIPGLPAGTYALLPARYALLPGAFLVTRDSAHLDIEPGQTFAGLDGGVVVAGQERVGAFLQTDSRLRGYTIRRGEFARIEARYDLTLASEFFARTEDSATTMRLPGDAGSLTLLPRSVLNLNGALLAKSADGGRGAALELAAESLRITKPGAAAGAPGEVLVTAQDLNSLGAASIVLGARTGVAKGSTAIDIVSRDVTIDPNVSLTAPELLLAASENIRVASGAQLASTTAAVLNFDDLSVAGDAAVIRVAGGPQAALARTGTVNGTSTITLEAGTKVSSLGSVMLDATGGMSLQGQLALSDASLQHDEQPKVIHRAALWLGASSIALGDAPAGREGLVLDHTQLAALDVSELVLRTPAFIDTFGTVALSLDSLHVSAAGIRAGDAASAVALSAAHELTLTGSAARTQVSATGAGNLTLSAERVRLEDGWFAFDGFKSATLAAGRETLAAGSGGLAAAGALTLTAQRLIGGNAVDYALEAGGALEIGPAVAVAAGIGDPERVVTAGLGARFDLAGTSVVDRGTIEAPAGLVRVAATTGGITLADGALIDVSGRSVDFNGVHVPAPAGAVELLSEHGDVRVTGNSSVDVSAADAADALGGRLALVAPEGTVDVAGARLLGRSNGGTGGAEAAVDAVAFGGFSALNAVLNAGGFSGGRDYRQRGLGDVVLAVNDSIRAHRVSLAADEGSVVIDGLLDASGASGGAVTLSALGDVFVQGVIDSHATDPNGRGGRVDLSSRAGLVHTGPASSIDVTGGGAGRGGAINVREPRTTLDALIGVSDGPGFVGTLRGHDRLNIEGYRSYAAPNGGTIGSSDTGGEDPTSSVWFQDAAAFASNETAILATLGLSTDARARVVPGLEIVSAGDLTIAELWDLSTWRFGANADRPGVLTLLAGGDLTLNAPLTDGFQATDPFSLLTATGDSWSYRLVAGADAAGADLLAVQRFPQPDAHGSVLLPVGSEPVVVRTGTGTIDVAAARNFELGDQTSVLYTAGVDSKLGVLLPGRAGAGLENRTYPDRGGDISIRVQGDILGAPSDQLVTDWLWRSGFSGPSRSAATAWTINHSRFQQNVGALGGGDVLIRAGGDILDFAASIPSIGRQVGGRTAALSRVEITGGGNLDVRAGGSIVGGVYFVGRGAASIRAEDSIGREIGAAGVDSTHLGPILALQDANVRVSARRDVGIESMLNPTLLPHGASQNVQASQLSFFGSYGASTRAELLAVGGDLHIFNDPDSRIATQFTSIVDPSKFVFGLYAPQLQAAALSGDLSVHSNVILYPSSAGDLRLFAGGNVELDDGVHGAQIVLADTDPAFLATIEHPTTVLDDLIFTFSSGGVFNPGFVAPVPGHSGDDAPAMIVAHAGDVRSRNVSTVLFSAKPIQISAGRDVADLDLIAQNLDDRSITSISAGRDVTFTTGRAADGSILTSDNQLAVMGPGRMQVSAGRSVDLQTSRGIATFGNTLNGALPDLGADVSVLAGIGPVALDYTQFVKEYVVDSSEYDDELFEYVGRYTNGPVNSKAQALAAFNAFGPDVKRGLLEAILFDEIRDGGRSAAAAGPTHDDFTDAFDALEAMFPGSNPDLDAGEKNAYAGDIRLFFSRIYTLAGGDISLIAPGGEVNVGLASPPTAFGIVKAPSDLGVVAQRTGSVASLSFADFQVNESRVFAADGGNILVWSTRGDIDAGRGAKTAISAPPPIITIDPQTGLLHVEFPPALTGSGIQTLATSEGKKPGNVDLFAPRGVVNAGDAGIVAGNLTIGATAVLGADNISVSGVSVGVPVDTGGFAAALSGVSAVASSATNAAEDTVAAGRQEQESATPLAAAALGFLDVFVTGFGDENGNDKKEDDDDEDEK